METDLSITNGSVQGHADGPPTKKAKLDELPKPDANPATSDAPERKRGIAPIKAEYVISFDTRSANSVRDDDTAEGQEKSKRRGQNKSRTFGKSTDERGLCASRSNHPEFSPAECVFGDKCRFEHDLRKYLKEHKREDLHTFGDVCPIWQARGQCPSGWKCRFVSSHMTERDVPDGRRELVLVEDEQRKQQRSRPSVAVANDDGIVNIVSGDAKDSLRRRKCLTPKSDAFIAWLDQTGKELNKYVHGGHNREDKDTATSEEGQDKNEAEEVKEENRARYTEPPFLPSEKRRLYFGPETPALAPLTTQGNLPFRRLCTDLGAQFTYSEMAMGLPLMQGQKSEWALMKAHETEMLPPTISSKANVVQNYDHSRDFKFGAQIAANKPHIAVKTTEILTALTPSLRVIDLNCGCPIDLVYREGAGSALLDSPGKLEKILRGMNAVSGEIPITVKIRMGTRDHQPTALKLAERLTLGGVDSQIMGIGPPGIAALTLHGRSRQQRYTRSADWGYISECAALVKRLRKQSDDLSDTIREPEERLQANGGKVYFLGNGDCFSYEDYNDHVQNANVDTVMVARGALIKPWIFEEIQAGQYLDKSATERLALVEKFARYGMDTWGSDEHGLGTTRRFLLEWLSFACRYIPVGILEYLPPNIQDRPPAWRGRNELETLLASDNYKDWIKVTDMFLGPAHQNFKFEPKHKSNAYDTETQG
ncbi:tRNA-dihydrouridine synthase 3 [Talaromyces proteolyticus]|uniref:tRNA-dihydrouridine(47) synthase [NAD(P)(+)] n=1 Tax=Talaromyces proteolyticus TaxID=1131652 RepID=A0AAD4KRL6_9EURO|nr:tRNA-dihydrouridine synthase 3 [Talaromyces proteolyticus]KAH8698870.1 tRNA-dihydrouridine synthase 3 [Talaromyces proteolyticus]